MSDGPLARSTWQVADMKKPLIQMAKVAVHLDRNNSRLVRPIGDVTPLHKAGNVVVIDFWIKWDASSSGEQQTRFFFHWQA